MAEPYDRLEEVIARAIELQEQGLEVSYTTLCGDRPELAAAVHDALAGRGIVRLWAEAGADDALRGRVLAGRYALGACLGSGAMGAVHGAADLELEREVAVKVMHPRPGRPAEAEQRFLREARALATLHHAHVVPVYDRGVTPDGLHFLVMERLAGIPLSRLLADVEERVRAHGWAALREPIAIDGLGAVPPHGAGYVRQCVQWAAELAAGLAAAHASGIIHRDVKPSNVFVTRDGQARLLDFGVAARLADATLTTDGTALGTPVYMAPEQVDGKGEPDAQLDVYSLSATLYHMLAARPPYHGTPAAVLAAIQRDDPEPIGRVHRGLPRDLQAIVECGMARDRTRRYGTAAALQADLRAFLDGKPIRARRLSLATRVWRSARRSAAVRITALVAVAAFTVLGARAWLEERQRQQHQEHARLYADLPPTLTFGKERVIADADDRQAQFVRLDRAVELRPDHQATRCLRAALRFDHDDLAGAAADFAALARGIGTPYARALAARYAHAAAQGSQDALDLSNLPDLTDADAFVAAFLALRKHQFQRAAALLPDDSEDLTVREFRLLALRGLGGNDEDLLIGLRGPALELGGAFGRPTARLLYVLEGALLQARRYEEALTVLEELAARAPRDYNVVLDLATAYCRTGQFGPAEEAARRAAELRRPGLNWKALSSLATALGYQGRFEEARAVAAEMPTEGVARWWRLETRGCVNLECALTLLETDPTMARAAAAEALRDYESAESLGNGPESLASRILQCRGIAEEDDDLIARALLLELDEEDLSSTLLRRNVSRLSAALRNYIHGAAKSRQHKD